MAKSERVGLTLLVLKMEEGSMSQGILAEPLETGKGRETEAPLEPPEGTQPSDTLILA